MAHSFDWLLDFAPWGADGERGECCDFALADFHARSGMIFGGDWRPHFDRWCARLPESSRYSYRAEALPPLSGIALIRVWRMPNRPRRVQQ